MTNASSLRILAAAAAVTGALASQGAAQDGKPPDAAKSKASEERTTAEKVAERPPDPDAGRYCANVAPSIPEARIAWQTKRLAELDGQIRQRIAELEKAEAAARDWIARREELTRAARDDVVAIYAKMEPENAARQLGALDDRTAAAILAKLKPRAAGAILGEMDPDRGSRLAGLIAGLGAEEKKS